MTPQQMMAGFKYVYEGFYSVRAILKRLFPPPPGNALETLAYLVANLKVNRYLQVEPERLGDDFLRERGRARRFPASI